MVTLTKPTPELRERLLAELGPDKRLVGMKMSAMGGSNPVALHSLTAVAGFVQVPPYEQAIRPNAQVTVGFVDLKALTRWLREVFGDEELAALVEGEATSGQPYGLVAPRVQEYLAARSLQIRDIDPESAEIEGAEGEGAEREGGESAGGPCAAPAPDPVAQSLGGGPLTEEYNNAALEELLSE